MYIFHSLMHTRNICHWYTFPSLLVSISPSPSNIILYIGTRSRRPECPTTLTPQTSFLVFASQKFAIFGRVPFICRRQSLRNISNLLNLFELYGASGENLNVPKVGKIFICFFSFLYQMNWTSVGYRLRL